MRRLFAACLGLISVVAAGSPALAAPPPPPPLATDDCPVAEAIGPGVHLVAGRDGAPSRDNAGLVINRVFLVGPTGIVVVDPGPTPAAGQSLRCTIRRASALPVVAIVLTHPHPENVLGAAAFPEAAIYASADAAEAMARRCERCQKHLAGLIGQPALGDLPPPRPDHRVTERQRVAPGGRLLTLLPLGAAHSPGDLAVLDAHSGLLIGGDAVNVGDLPDLHDGHVDGLRAALRRLSGMDGVAAVVPGRGRPFSLQRLGEPLRYLDALWRYAEERVEMPDGFVPPPSLPAALQAFPGDPARHALNLQHALREAEAAWWRRPPVAGTR